MTRTRPREPTARMGVYQQLDQVPERYRFRNYEQTYGGRDVWAEYVAAVTQENPSDSFRRECERAERAWKAHMDEHGRHHALATPGHVEAFLNEKAVEASLATVYKPYWARLEDFYTWLQHHTDYPHVYNPPLMAATDSDSTAAEIWWTQKFKYNERDSDVDR